jgi:hypothetical protein
VRPRHCDDPDYWDDRPRDVWEALGVDPSDAFEIPDDVDEDLHERADAGAYDDEAAA